MKLIMAIIQPHALDRVREALQGINIHGLTVTEVRGYGRQKGHTEVYRGAEYQIAYVPKVKIELAVAEDSVQSAIDTIREAAASGRIGDGKVFVLDLQEAMRIRTGEMGDGAL
ncbi:MAG: P-II family nitrogen regulator [Alphaproteobacteria bacterium]